MGELTPLSAIDRNVLALLQASAEAGEACPSNEAIAEAVGFNSVAAPPGVLSRLERRGFIRVGRFQRSRIVTIVATGQSTRPPHNTRAHWRHDEDRPAVPTPSVSSMRERHPDMFTMIQTAAMERGCTISDYLCDLVYAGWRARSGERAI